MIRMTPKSPSKSQRIYILPATSFVSDILRMKSSLTSTKQGFGQGGGCGALAALNISSVQEQRARNSSVPSFL